ncbi:MAG: SDR family oxidoreductase [Syntrophothermus sp.]
MAKQTILITGSTDGIGRQTAYELAALGHTVLIHGRSADRCQKTAEEIKKETGNSDLYCFTADLASLEQVRKLAGEVKSQFPSLNVLINNAGVFSKDKKITKDGFELTFQVNHLSHYLLTVLLIDVLKRNSPSRIINVSSTAHQSADFDINNLQGESYYNSHNAYSLAKLCNLLFTFELAEKLKGTNVTVNALHPGVISTKMLQDAFNMAGASLKEGAETSVFLADSDEVSGKSGHYYVRKKEARVSSAAENESNRKKLWELSARLTGEEGNF